MGNTFRTRAVGINTNKSYHTLQMDKSPDFFDAAVEIETERLKLVPVSMQWKLDCFREFNADITTYMHHSPPKDPSVVENNIRRFTEELKQGTNLQLVVLK